MFPFLSGMLSGLLGSGAGGAAASGLGGMAANGMGSGAAGNLAGIGEMASSGGQVEPASANGDPLANPVQNNGGVNAGMPPSGHPGGMVQAPTQGQSPLMQLPTMNGQDPLMNQNSLLNGGGLLKMFGLGA